MSSLLRLLGLSLLLVLAGCSEDDDPYAPAPLPDIENQFEPKVLWQTDVGEGMLETTGRLVPTYAYGKIYIADAAGTIATVDPDSGKTLWKRETGLEIGGGPGVGSGHIAVGTHQGELVLFDAESGEEKWRRMVTSEVVSVPAIGDGHVVVRTVDGRIFAFDLESGEQKWFYDQIMPSLTLRGESSPIIHAGGAIAGFSNGKLGVFILENGQMAWEKRIATAVGRSEIQRLTDIDVKPVVVGATVYVGSFNGNIASIDLRSGDVNWQRELSTYQELNVDELILLVTHENSYVSAFNRTNGVPLWTQKQLTYRQLTMPVGLGDSIVVGDFEGYLHFMARKDGRLQAQIHLDSSGFSQPPLKLDDKVIFYSNDGTLYAVAKP